MFLPLLILFLDTFDTARATLSFSQARQTTIQDDVSGLQSGWTPKPTSPPTFLPWLGAASRGQLYTRQEVNPETCGWLSGDPDKPLECGTAEVCAFYNSYETKGYVCCPTTASGSIEAGSCPYRSSCMNFGQVGNEHWGTGEFVGTDAVLSCGYWEPFCYAMVNSASAGGDTWWFFGCDTATGLYSAAMTWSSVNLDARPTSRTAIPQQQSPTPVLPPPSGPGQEQSISRLETPTPTEQLTTGMQQQIIGV